MKFAIALIALFCGSALHAQPVAPNEPEISPQMYGAARTQSPLPSGLPGEIGGGGIPGAQEPELFFEMLPGWMQEMILDQIDIFDTQSTNIIYEWLMMMIVGAACATGLRKRRRRVRRRVAA